MQTPYGGVLLVGMLLANFCLLTAAQAAPPASQWGVDARDFAVLSADALARKARVGERAPLLERAAAAGDADAAVLLGVARLYGLGVAKDEAGAARLIRLAAEAGHPRGVAGWGGLLLNGVGVAANPTEGRAWARRGAEAGNAVAMLNLAGALEFGKGGAVDRKSAAEWVQRAAELGSVDAMFTWGDLLRAGRPTAGSDPGLARNPTEAARWYRRAARAGSAGAMQNLGLMLATGDGVAKNVDEGERWLRAAAHAGNALALTNLVSVLQTQLQAAPTEDGPARRLLLRFTASSCSTCRAADEAWAAPAFQSWLASRAKQVVIDVDREATLAQKLGITREQLAPAGSALQPLVVLYRRDGQPQVVRVAAENPRAALEARFDGEYRSVFADGGPARPLPTPVTDPDAAAPSRLPDLRDPLALAMYAKGCEDAEQVNFVIGNSGASGLEAWKRVREGLERWVVHYGHSLFPVVQVNTFGQPKPPCAADLARLRPQIDALVTDVYAKTYASVREGNLRRAVTAAKQNDDAFDQAAWCASALSAAVTETARDPAVYRLDAASDAARKVALDDLEEEAFVQDLWTGELAVEEQALGIDATETRDRIEKAFASRLESMKSAGVSAKRLFVWQEAEVCRGASKPSAEPPAR